MQVKSEGGGRPGRIREWRIGGSPGRAVATSPSTWAYHANHANREDPDDEDED